MSIDRRTSPRIPIDLSTLLTSKKMPPKICRMRDYCDGGMLLVCSEGFAAPSAADPFGPGDALELRFTVESADGKQRCQVKAKVARVLEGSLGVAFDHIDPQVLTALHQVSDDAQQHNRHTPQQGRIDPQLARDLLRQVRQQAESKLAGMLGQFFAAVGAELTAAAERASNNHEEGALFEQIKEVKVRQTPLKAHYRSRLLERFDACAAGEVTANQAAKAKQRLSATEKEEFDDWLVMVTLIHRADDRFDEPLYELSLRLSEVMGAHLNKETNPVAPAAICRAFHAACGEVRPSLHLRQLIFGLFDKHYLTRLGGFYHDLNQLFIDQGVLPKIEHRAPDQQTAKNGPRQKPTAQEQPDTEPAPKPAPETAAAQPAPPAPAETPQHAPEPPKAKPSGLFSAARSLFGFEAEKPSAPAAPKESPEPQAQPAAPAEAMEETTDPGQFMDALSALQTREKGQTEPLAALSERVSQAMQDQSDSAPIGPREHELLGVVENLLSNIEHDLMMAKGLQRWLRKLEVPMLKAAFLDPDAVSSEENPVGRIVNQLAKLGHAVDDEGQVINKQLGEKIDGLFDRLLDDFDWDFAPFDQAAAELESLMAPQEGAYQNALQRVMQSCEGQQRLLEARETVTTELAAILGGEPIPAVIAEIEREAWRQLLLQVYLREGAASKRWNEYLTGLKRLLELSHKTAAVKPGAAEVEAMRVLKRGFDHVGANPNKADHWMRETAKLITGRNPDRPLVAIRAEQLKTELEQALPDFDAALAQPPEGYATGHWRALLLQALALEINDWVRQEHPTKGPQALRLIWIGKDHRRFVFINRRGLKELDLSLPELALVLGQEVVQSIPDPDLSLTERASYRTLEQMHDAVVREATHDPLTGLLNRRAIGRQILRVMETVRAEQSAAGFLHLEIDHLQRMSDRLGLEGAENHLRACAITLSAEAPRGAAAARLGAASLGLLLPAHDLEQARERAEALRARLAQAAAGPSAQNLTVSIGLTCITTETGDPQQALKEAQAACDQAKAEGGERVRVWPTAERTQSAGLRAATRRNRITEAAANHRLELLAQPIAPIGGAAAAAQLYAIFPRLAETPGATAELAHDAAHYSRMPVTDRWVVGHLLQWLAETPATNHAAYIVNLSHASLSDPEFLRFTLQALEQHRVDPKRLCFQLTATARLESSAAILRQMRALSKIGLRFALDDFGAGAASFSQLKKLPVAYLKIHGGFVNQITESAADLALVRSISEVAHFFGKRTVAEQVENTATLALLQQIGVDLAQGRLIQAPQPLKDLRA